MNQKGLSDGNTVHYKLFKEVVLMEQLQKMVNETKLEYVSVLWFF